MEAFDFITSHPTMSIVAIVLEKILIDVALFLGCILLVLLIIKVAKSLKKQIYYNKWGHYIGDLFCELINIWVYKIY